MFLHCVMPLHITMIILDCIRKCDKYAVKNRKVNIGKITLILQELVGGSCVETPKVKSNTHFKNLCVPKRKVN